MTVSRPLRTLLLEDNPHDAELARELLSKTTSPVRSPGSKLAEFVAALESKAFDLILADYSLPSFDGLSALEFALRLRPDVPFIFVSGTLGEELAIEALKRGATDYVLKTRLSRLVPSVQRALRETEHRAERKRAEDELRAAEERFRNFVNHATDGFFLFDEHRAIVDVNRQACESLGYSRDEMIGMHPGDFDAAPTRLRSRGSKSE